jgi:hypothetical protein
MANCERVIARLSISAAARDDDSWLMALRDRGRSVRVLTQAASKPRMGPAGAGD